MKSNFPWGVVSGACFSLGWQFGSLSFIYVVGAITMFVYLMNDEGWEKFYQYWIGGIIVSGLWPIILAVILWETYKDRITFQSPVKFVKEGSKTQALSVSQDIIDTIKEAWGSSYDVTTGQTKYYDLLSKQENPQIS